MEGKYRENRKIHGISKVYQRGKTQIPSEVRRSLGLIDGDKVLWVTEGTKWIVERA
jgi:bifunctional DNA-binding transcriptional regulator/antitoxin component of YhaV-PrlF toxin-antitoxin module